MSHPEIPKDHPRFNHHILGGDTFYTFLPTHAYGFKKIDMLVNGEREDCAAHAAAWWFNRSQEICDSENGDPVDMLKATEIALAWLKWGAE